jgi:hypothetical protein
MQHHFEILEYAKARQHDLREASAAQRRADALRGDAPNRVAVLARRAAALLAARLQRTVPVRRSA